MQQSPIALSMRPLTPDDEPFLWEMLFQAIHVPDGYAPLSRDVLNLPELARYVQEWWQARAGPRLPWVVRPILDRPRLDTSRL